MGLGNTLPKDGCRGKDSFYVNSRWKKRSYYRTGRGIGEAMARAFVEAGANVAVVSRTESNSKRVADALDAVPPGAARAYALDVADYAACQEAGKQIAGISVTRWTSW